MASAAGVLPTRPAASMATDSLPGSSACACCSSGSALAASGTPSQARASATRAAVRVAGWVIQSCTTRSTSAGVCVLSPVREKKPGSDWISPGRSASGVSWISERKGSIDSSARLSATSSWIR